MCKKLFLLLFSYNSSYFFVKEFYICYSCFGRCYINFYFFSI